MIRKERAEAAYQAKLQAEMEAAGREYDARREARWMDERPTEPPAADVGQAIAIARIVLRLGEVERITLHPDGQRHETDTTHTLMLALAASTLAPARLDFQAVLQLALVHDLAEAYAGDTPTLVKLDAAGQAAKDAREAAAVQRIRSELGADSWIAHAIDEFEAQETPEARWVKHLDKCMPKLTHCLNGGAAIRAQGVTLDATSARVDGQIAAIGADLPEAAAFAREAWAAVVGSWGAP